MEINDPRYKAYGHAGMVQGISPDGKTVYTIEANADGSCGTGTKCAATSNNVSVRERPINEIYGFFPPKSGQLVNSATGDVENGLYQEFIQEAKNSGITNTKDQKKFADERLKASYTDMTEFEAKAYDAYITTQEEAKVYDSLMKNTDVEDFADTVNVISNKIKETGLTPEVINRFVTDPTQRRAIYSEMRWLQSILRKESGAAIGKTEYDSYGSQYFPRAGDDEKTIQDKANARSRKEKSLYGQIGASGKRQFNELQTSGGFDTATEQPQFAQLKQMPGYQELKQVLTQKGNTRFTLRQLQALLDEGWTIGEVTEYFNK
jgi:hypothetical protein